MPHLISPPNPDWNNTPFGLENQRHFPICGPFYPCPSNAASFPGGNIARLGLPNGWCPALSSYGVHENAVQTRSISVPNINSHNSGSQDWGDFKLKDANEVPLASPNSGSRYMLFGVNLVNNPPELPSPQVVTSSEHESHYSVPPTSQSTVSAPSKSTSGTNSKNQCKNCCSATNRSCTKVLYFSNTLAMFLEATSMKNQCCYNCF